MLTAIAVAAVKAITGYLVTSYMKMSSGSIDIEGAPFWYGRELDSEICVSDARRGGVLELDREKKAVKVKLQKRLSSILDSAIHTNSRFSNLKPDEENFLDSIIHDKKLGWFVAQNGVYKNIKVDEDRDMIFIRMCVSKDDFINFEKRRVKTLQKEMTLYRSDKAFDELEGKENNFTDRENKSFRELDNSF